MKRHQSSHGAAAPIFRRSPWELCARDAADDAGRLGSLCPLEQLMSLDEIVPQKNGGIWGSLKFIMNRTCLVEVAALSAFSAYIPGHSLLDAGVGVSYGFSLFNE